MPESLPSFRTSRPDVSGIRISGRQKSVMEGKESTNYQISYTRVVEGITQHRTTEYMAKSVARRKLIDLGVAAEDISLVF